MIKYVYKVRTYFRHNEDKLDFLHYDECTGEFGLYSSWNKAIEFIDKCFASVGRSTPECVVHYTLPVCGKQDRNPYERIYDINDKEYFLISREDVNPKYDEGYYQEVMGAAIYPEE